MDKIAADLLRLIEERDAERADAAARGDAGAAREIAGRAIQVEVVFDGDLSAIVEAGFPLDSIVPELAGAHLTTDQVRALAELPVVRGLRRPARKWPLLETSKAQIRANEPMNVPTEAFLGRGVTIGVIDDGFFASVKALRDPQGKTTITRLWDQTFKFNAAGDPVSHDDAPLTGDNEPKSESGVRATRALNRTPKATGLHADLDYGIDFTNEQINTALNAAQLPISLTGPLTGISGSHGTSVACVAAGQAAISGGGFGVAPLARLIVVKSGFSARELTHAIKYIVAAAKKTAQDENVPLKPIVINCSFGGHSEPHNGMGPAARLFDQVMADDPNVAIVIGAGNSRSDNGHAALQIQSGSKGVLHFMIWGDLPELNFFCSYNAGASLTCRIANGRAVESDAFSVSAGGANTVREHVVGVAPYASHSLDPDRHFHIVIKRLPKQTVENGRIIVQQRTIEKGMWTIELEVDPQSTMPAAFIHVWRSFPSQTDATEFVPLPPQPTSPQDVTRPESIVGALRAQARQRRPESWIRGTVTSDASSRRAIVVGAYDPAQDPAPLGHFSSQGPDASNLMAGLYVDFPGKVAKPDIAAPGVNISVTSVVDQGGPLEGRIRQEGTSFAAPFVAGVVALMWAAKPTLTNVQIKQLLLEAARGPLDPRLIEWAAHNPKAREELWGAGVLDAFEAVKKAKQHQ